MGIKIIPYSENMIESVIDFNQRLAECGATDSFPESNIPTWLPKVADRKIYQECFLAVENNSIVRGGYILKHQDFFLKGSTYSFGVPQIPISEGLINNSYNIVAIQLLTDALKKKELLYGLGIGSYNAPIYHIHKALGFSSITVPFFFKVNKPFQFFRKISYLRNSFVYRLMLDFLAFTGIGILLINVFQYLVKKKHINKESISIELIQDFGEWSDKLWEECKNEFSIIAIRDSKTLNILYSKNKFIRMRISLGNQIIGWVVVLDTQMNNHKQFGNMRVGSIIDCLAKPDNESIVVACATDYLERRGVDILISNQSNHRWCSALKESGFINGPSNFIFTASKKLTELIKPIDTTIPNSHFNRGDADGPINL